MVVPIGLGGSISKASSGLQDPQQWGKVRTCSQIFISLTTLSIAVLQTQPRMNTYGAGRTFTGEGEEEGEGEGEGEGTVTIGELDPELRFALV